MEKKIAKIDERGSVVPNSNDLAYIVYIYHTLIQDTLKPLSPKKYVCNDNLINYLEII